MKDKAILDSSFIASLFFLDNFTEWAREEVKNYRNLITVNFSKVEVFNVAWKRIALFNEDSEIMKTALQKAVSFINTLHILDAEDYLEYALQIGLKQKITIYNSLFVAAALRNNGFLANNRYQIG